MIITILNICLNIAVLTIWAICMCLWCVVVYAVYFKK